MVVVVVVVVVGGGGGGGGGDDRSNGGSVGVVVSVDNGIFFYSIIHVCSKLFKQRYSIYIQVVMTK